VWRALGVGDSAYALVIDPTFGPGVSAQAETAVEYVDSLYERDFTNPITININVDGEVGGGGLGESSTNLQLNVPYDQLRAALTAEYATAPSAFRTTASGAGGSVNSTVDEPPGGTVAVPLAEAKALGLRAANDPVSDGTFLYDSTASYTFDPNNRAVAGEFDFIGVAEHEISEIMGRIDGVFNFGFGPAVVPYDLFYYTGVGVRLGGPATPYFSIDNGVTDLHGYSTIGDLTTQEQLRIRLL